MTESCLLPEFDIRQASEIASRLFALEGAIRQLDGERDLNYLITTDQGKFVFKIANGTESSDALRATVSGEGSIPTADLRIPLHRW